MGDIHTFTPPEPRPRRAGETDLASEAIRRGVQYLAFRPEPAGLRASYAPGPGPVNGHVERAAQAAVEAHEALAADLAAPAATPARSAAVLLRQRLARQLAELKAGVGPPPAAALRSAYLDALAEVMIETLRRGGAARPGAWARPGGANQA